MKKILLFLLVIISLLGCSNDDPETYTYEVLPIESYTVPARFTLGETYEIKLKYQRPSSCHLFQGIYYSKDLNKRTIAIQVAAKDNQICNLAIPPLSETSFNFLVTANEQGSYIFKFYKGKDADGKDLFEEVEIPVE
jgi:hypothetical protein